MWFHDSASTWPVAPANTVHSARNEFTTEQLEAVTTDVVRLGVARHLEKDEPQPATPHMP
jgi:hypothetical protein